MEEFGFIGAAFRLVRVATDVSVLRSRALRRILESMFLSALEIQKEVHSYKKTLTDRNSKLN